MLDYISLLTCLHYIRTIIFYETSKPTGYLSKLKEEKKQKQVKPEMVTAPVHSFPVLH